MIWMPFKTTAERPQYFHLLNQFKRSRFKSTFPVQREKQQRGTCSTRRRPRTWAHSRCEGWGARGKSWGAGTARAVWRRPAGSTSQGESFGVVRELEFAEGGVQDPEKGAASWEDQTRACCRSGLATNWGENSSSSCQSRWINYSSRDWFHRLVNCGSVVLSTW